MREIKFRAWDKEHDSMIYPEDIDTAFCFEGNILTVYDLNSVNEDDNVLPHLDCDLMQYTGLKDIHGQEVYEGDIVKYYSMIQDKEVLAEVVFKEGCFVINEYYLGNKKRFEVMGNIYENPELMEVEQ